MIWILVLVLFPTLKLTYKQPMQADNRYYKTAANEQQIDIPLSAIPSAQTVPAASKTTNQCCNPSRPIWKDPQWWAAVGSVLAGIVALCTLIALKSQIDAIRNTERAVLVPIWEDLVHINPEAGNGVLSHCFQWKFQNCGKTPAFIREVYGEMRLIDSFDDLPRKPKYGDGVGYQGDPLLPDKAMDRNIYSPLKPSRTYESVEEEYRVGAKILFAFGFVKYDDMFGNSHETRFAVRYRAERNFGRQDHWEIAGPKAYNTYK